MKFIWNEFENILPISNPGMAKTTAKASDSDDSDDLPDLVDCTDDEVLNDFLSRKIFTFCLLVLC